MRPSFSISSLSPCTMRRPRLTRVSELKSPPALAHRLVAEEITLACHDAPPFLRGRGIKGRRSRMACSFHSCPYAKRSPWHRFQAGQRNTRSKVQNRSRAPARLKWPLRRDPGRWRDKLSKRFGDGFPLAQSETNQRLACLDGFSTVFKGDYILDKVSPIPYIEAVGDDHG